MASDTAESLSLYFVIWQLQSMFKYVLSLCVIILASCIAVEDNQAKPDWAQDIDALIESESPRRFNGVILITKNGETQYLKSLGFADFETQTLLSTDDNFRIQSNSKQITAVIILKAYEAGLINLNAPISDYLPDLAQPWGEHVTVHHLLNMTSGITSLDEKLMFAPGTQYKYSNPGYILLGRIYKSVTGIDISTAANDLFDTLQMSNSFAYDLEDDRDRVVKGYINNDNVFEYFDFHSEAVGFTEESWGNFVPTGGYISNLKDLDIWDTKLHGGDLLDPQSYALMTAYDVTNAHVTFGNMGYGYGVMISDGTPIKHIGHAGSGLGSVSIKFHVPEHGLNVIVLENQYIRNDRDKLYYFEKRIKEIVLNSSLVK